MVLADAFHNFIAQFVFFGHFHAFFNMVDEDQCRHGRGKFIMAVSAVRLILDTSCEVVVDAVAHGDRVWLHGFGTFYPRDYGARNRAVAASPRQGSGKREVLSIGPKRVIRYKSAKAVKEHVAAVYKELQEILTR